MTEHQLTTDAIKKVFTVPEFQNAQTPMTLMVIATKPVYVDEELKKYRVMLSDGVYSTHGLIDEVMVPYISTNQMAKYSIVKITDYSAFCTQKHMLLIKGLTILTGGLEKPTNDSVSIEKWFVDHPEDDYVAINKEARESSLEVDQSKKQSPAPPQKYPAGVPAATKKDRITPIDALSPYQNQWKLKARVSFKGDLKQWRNTRGEGKLFSVNFLDESDEIRATAFNEVAEKLYQMLQEGKVYYISKARVQNSKKPFNQLSHPYELLLDRDTIVEECFDTADIPTINFSFVGLDQVGELEANSIIDVIGVLKTVNPAFQITAKSTGKAFDRRNIVIVDQSGFEIELGLWNQTAVDFDTPEGTVTAFKACKVQDFNGRSLSLTQTGTMVANPDTTECFKLKGWFDNGGFNENFKSLKVESAIGGKNSVRKTVNEAEEEKLGHSDKPDFFTIRGTIGFVKSDTFAYPACVNPREVDGKQTSTRGPQLCNRKMTENGDRWRCEKCDIYVAEPTYRYVVTCAAMDHTGQIWFTLFDEDAKKLFGVDAGELVKLREALQYDELLTGFKDIIKKPVFHEYIIRLKAKSEMYNEQLKVRYQCQAIETVDYSHEVQALADELSAIFG